MICYFIDSTVIKTEMYDIVCVLQGVYMHTETDLTVACCIKSHLNLKGP